MKLHFLNFIILSAFTGFLISCESNPSIEPDSYKPFLSEIRPTFFDHLDFNSEEQRGKISSFLKDFTNTYTQLEEDHKNGLFTSEYDLDNMRLAGMYYSFGLTAITRAYLDGFIEFSDIIGDSQVGLLSGLPVDSQGFQQKELEAMMKKSQEVAFFAMYVNGFNDKTYATYMVSRQIRERVKSDKNFNNPHTQDSMINYVDSRIKDFQLFSEWNVLMSQLSFTNYNDTINTFKNPRMNVVLSNLNRRLVIGSIPDLNGRFAEILAPMFRFDSNLKKIDWLVNEKIAFTEEEIDELTNYVDTLDELMKYVTEDKIQLLEAWNYKETIYERAEKLAEVKSYIDKVADGKSSEEVLELQPYLTSKSFLQAYQCYNCHQQVNLN